MLQDEADAVIENNTLVLTDARAQGILEIG